MNLYSETDDFLGKRISLHHGFRHVVSVFSVLSVVA